MVPGGLLVFAPLDCWHIPLTNGIRPEWFVADQNRQIRPEFARLLALHTLLQQFQEAGGYILVVVRALRMQ